MIGAENVKLSMHPVVKGLHAVQVYASVRILSVNTFNKVLFNLSNGNLTETNATLSLILITTIAKKQDVA